MKKIFVILVALIGFGISAFALCNLIPTSSIDVIVENVTIDNGKDKTVENDCEHGKCAYCGTCFSWDGTCKKVKTSQKCHTCGGDGLADIVDSKGNIKKNAQKCNNSSCWNGYYWKWQGCYNCHKCNR